MMNDIEGAMKEKERPIPEAIDKLENKMNKIESVLGALRTRLSDYSVRSEEKPSPLQEKVDTEMSTAEKAIYDLYCKAEHIQQSILRITKEFQG